MSEVNGFKGNGHDESNGSGNYDCSQKYGLLIHSGGLKNISALAALAALGLSSQMFSFVVRASSGSGVADHFSSGNSKNFLRGWVRQANHKHFKTFKLKIDNRGIARVSYDLLLESGRKIPEGVVEHAVYSPYDHKTVFIPVTMENTLETMAASCAVPGYAKPISIKGLVEEAVDGGLDPLEVAEYFVSSLKTKKIKGVVLHNLPNLLNRDPGEESYFRRLALEERSSRILTKRRQPHLFSHLEGKLRERPFSLRMAQATLQTAEEEGILVNLYPSDYLKISITSASQRGVVEQYRTSRREFRGSQESVYKFLGIPRDPIR